jgi:hypothetical protein
MCLTSEADYKLPILGSSHPLFERFPVSKSGPPKAFDVIIDYVGSQPLFRNYESYLNREGRYVQPGADSSSWTALLRALRRAAWNGLWPGWAPGGVARMYKFFATSVEDAESIVDTLTLFTNWVEEGQFPRLFEDVCS